MVSQSAYVSVRLPLEWILNVTKWHFFCDIAQILVCLAAGPLELKLHSSIKGSRRHFILQWKTRIKVFLHAKYRGRENKKVQVKCKRAEFVWFSKEVVAPSSRDPWSYVAKWCFLGAFDTTLLTYKHLNTFPNKLITLRKYITLYHQILLQIKDCIDPVQTAGLAVWRYFAVMFPYSWISHSSLHKSELKKNNNQIKHNKKKPTTFSGALWR